MANPYTLRNNTGNTDPIYGFNRSYSIADLSSTYNSGIVAIQSASADTTSPPIRHGGNGVEIAVKFSDGVTSVSVDVAGSNGIVIKTFNNVTETNNKGLFIGYADNGILLGGDPITVRVYNFNGGGRVQAIVRRTS